MANVQLTLTRRAGAPTLPAWRPWAARLAFELASGLASGLWRELEAIGRARARRNLRALAANCALTDPARAQLLRDASDSLRPH